MLAVGRVERPHGVRGLMKMKLFDASSQTMQSVSEIHIGDETYTVTEARRLGGKVAAYLLGLRGVSSREEADRLRGAVIEVPRVAVPLAPGELFVADLIGCEAFDPTGRPLGAVQEVFHSGAHEVLVLGEDRMVPLVAEWVLGIDLAARRITVEPHDAF